MNHLDKILKKMCSYVNADYKKIDFEKGNWYLQYQWTTETEDKFVFWLTDYLFKNKEAFNQLSKSTYKSKSNCRLTAKDFALDYGWSYKHN